MTHEFCQIRFREGAAVGRVDHMGICRKHCFPGRTECAEIFYPDNKPMDAGKSVHGGIAAKDDVSMLERDRILRMTGGK